VAAEVGVGGETMHNAPLKAHAEAAAAELLVFRTSDVARILGVTPARVRAIVRTGLRRPQRRGRALAFSFQDVVLLRAAHGLRLAAVPAQRVRRALSELARQLPPDRPLSGVRIYADGRQVVARDGGRTWKPESGQLVFSFGVDELVRAAGVVVPVTRRRPQSAPAKVRREQEAMVWFERAQGLEGKANRIGAKLAYERALRLDPELSDAYINLGRLVHEDGDAIEAGRLYHLAIEHAPEDPIAHYDLALALEDQAHPTAAIKHYERAIEIDDEFADAHFNLGRLLDHLGHHDQALRHLLAYRKITEGEG
jgi:tetratricopeptide (TPR) repeat protein